MSPEVWAGMATIDDREEGRRAAVASLEPQVDQLTVTDGTRSGDFVKFVSCAGAPEVFMSVDDDLVYPPDYVERMLQGLEDHPGCIVSCHGWRIGETGANVANFRCLEQVDGDHQVHVAGTGVMAFHVDTIRLTPDDFDAPNVADMFVACIAEQRGIERWVLGHEDGWLKYTEPPDTIWRQTAYATGGPLDASRAKKALLDQLRFLVHYKDSIQYV